MALSSRDSSPKHRAPQVLFISSDPDAYAFQPGSTLKMRKWDGEFRDRTLLDILPLLQVRWLYCCCSVPCLGHTAAAADGAMSAVQCNVQCLYCASVACTVQQKRTVLLAFLLRLSILPLLRVGSSFVDCPSLQMVALKGVQDVQNVLKAFVRMLANLRS